MTTLMPEYPVFPLPAHYVDGRPVWGADQMINYARLHGLKCMHIAPLAQPVQPASELDALRADAARYRWLRNEAYECVVPHGMTVLGKRTGWITKIHPGVSYDDAIDAAIKEPS